MFDHTSIEKDIQAYWKSIDAYKTDLSGDKPKKYILDMFPYPSGAGLHVGHVEGYTATDIVARYFRMNGHEVLHPMGWDSFGLPAENYAMKVGKHPRISTDDNIQNFTKQINAMGKSIDWSKEIDTSSPEYYKWSQWFFLLLYKNGLAYRKESPVNWCPKDQTVLANEQVVDGKCERCKTEIIQKNLPQWFFKVTAYADRLTDDLDKLDWPHSLKEMQRNWIGRSNGVTVPIKVKDLDMEFEVYDSVPQTYMAQTFTVIAPEHPLLPELVKGTEQEKEVLDFIEKIKKKKLANKFEVDKDIEGVFTGRYIQDPYGIGDLPIWVASFVVADYGTGVVNCSAHDERDFAFAKKYNIPLNPVMFPEDESEAEKIRNLEYCYFKAEEGILDSPQEFKGRKWGEAREDILNHIEKTGIGKRSVQYKIRDWLLSRQRFWGAPIPIVYCNDCGIVPIPESDLPVLLPKEADFTLKGDGKSPLARVDEFVNTTCPKCSGAAKRETDTMDGFVDNSWYYFRYLDPKNDQAFANKDVLKNWMPVDLYVGGAEHAVGHLIYSRFFTKVLFDQNYIDFDEPFKKLVNQGIILAEDGQKMSKSLGNVVNPDDVIAKHGADALRVFEMFLGPLTDSKPWSTSGMTGVRRFLDRIYSYYQKVEINSNHQDDKDLIKQLHKLIDKVTKDTEELRFNTAIAKMMEFLNSLEKQLTISQDTAQIFLQLVSPYAPHLAEYLWQEMHNDQGSITQTTWPKANPELMKDSSVILPIQVNGKVRDKIEIDINLSQEQIEALAKESENIKKYLEGQTIKKVVYVPSRIMNFIV